MTKWGYGLLAIYLVLAVSPVGWRKAGQLATLMTVLVMAYAFHAYHAL
jgi:hypothetical protein